TPTLQPGEVVHDPHLVARGFASDVTHLDGRTRPTLGVPWLIDARRADTFRRPPRLGEDNTYVFGELLGLSPADIETLIADHVIYGGARARRIRTRAFRTERRHRAHHAESTRQAQRDRPHRRRAPLGGVRAL